MPSNLSLFAVNAVLILAADDGSRILTKYYSSPHPPAGAEKLGNYPGANPYPALKEQKAFEKGLFDKTAKQTSDIILYDNRIVVFKSQSDVMLYVIGGVEENEILLHSVVVALRDSLDILLKYVTMKYFAIVFRDRLPGAYQVVMLMISKEYDGQAHDHREL